MRTKKKAGIFPGCIFLSVFIRVVLPYVLFYFFGCLQTSETLFHNVYVCLGYDVSNPFRKLHCIQFISCDLVYILSHVPFSFHAGRLPAPVVLLAQLKIFCTDSQILKLCPDKFFLILKFFLSVLFNSLDCCELLKCYLFHLVFVHVLHLLPSFLAACLLPFDNIIIS